MGFAGCIEGKRRQPLASRVINCFASAPPNRHTYRKGSAWRRPKLCDAALPRRLGAFALLVLATSRFDVKECARDLRRHLLQSVLEGRDAML